MRRTARRRAARRDVGKIAGAVGLVSASVGMVARGANASFTATTSTSHSTGSGTISLSVPAAGATNRLSLASDSLKPGDSAYRAVNLILGGTINYKNMLLTTTATTSSSLDTDTTNGLQMKIDRCSVAWTESGSSPDYTYTCSGTTSAVLTSRAIIGTKVLSNLALTAGSTNHLMFTFTLPTSSPSSMQGAASQIEYSFDGAPRDGTNK